VQRVSSLQGSHSSASVQTVENETHGYPHHASRDTSAASGTATPQKNPVQDLER
jgi:hypothetical protein